MGQPIRQSKHTKFRGMIKRWNSAEKKSKIYLTRAPE